MTLTWHEDTAWWHAHDGDQLVATCLLVQIDGAWVWQAEYTGGRAPGALPLGRNGSILGHFATGEDARAAIEAHVATT